MELVPILSLIVLVATILTFILSIGAYIHYKIRERKGSSVKAAQPVAIEAELVTPAPLMNQRRFGQTGFRTYAEEQYITNDESRGTQVSENTRITDRAGTSGRTTNNESLNAARQYTSDPGNTKITETGKRKFMRYTSDGFIDTEEDKKTTGEKLRWQ